MKTLKKAPQILIGIIPVMLLWLISCIFQDDIFVTTLFKNIIKNENIVQDSFAINIPVIAVISILLFILIRKKNPCS